MSYNPTPYPSTSTTTSGAAADAPRADAASLTGLPASAPAHHLHKSSDVLPGAQHAQGAQADVDHHHTHTRAPVPALQPDSHSHAHESHTGARRNAPGPRGAIERQPELELDADGRNAWTEEPGRSAEHGGVAVGGRTDAPETETHASAADKLVGTTQKVVGKMTGKPEMHERGELRKSGGKAAAARGEGRAAHDSD